MNATARTYPAGNIRVSDADRDAALSELSEHFQAGRLTADELDDRTGRAISARTGQDLAELMTDLPADAAAGPRQAETRRRHQPGLRAPSTTAVTLVAIAAVILVVNTVGHRGGSIPWWLIPVAFLAVRQVARCGRRTSSGEGWHR